MPASGLGECVEPADSVAGGGSRYVLIAQKVSAPSWSACSRETLMRSLFMRMTRSASLLSKGTRRSEANRR